MAQVGHELTRIFRIYKLLKVVKQSHALLSENYVEKLNISISSDAVQSPWPQLEIA